MELVGYVFRFARNQVFVNRRQELLLAQRDFVRLLVGFYNLGISGFSTINIE